MIDYWKEWRDLRHRAKRNRSTLKRRFVQNNKIGKPCADCGVKYPPHVLQYDHVTGEKVANLNKMYLTHTMEEIVEEIAKCEIVCGNCHAHRGWKRSIGG